ncbi:nose resistant to fluoxetine protein 6-like [Contarinia nasturtii]|uniref:nose resistant to fluoxetine protein 6-like n=1 Tax=Contarinia nasturtii TaxID=265458 RepID=UPI0012D4BC56|nr:nose resistant to fluoxetine protein 6-like [Contarinia nasturtii]
MSKISIGILSLYLFLLLFVKSVRCEKRRSFFFDFEQMKYDLFFESYSKISSNNTEPHNNNNKCLTELEAIQDGLIAQEEWALRILDSWGKIPSGVFSGNTHDYGMFSQCMKIKQDREVYETQYCLGQLFYDLDEKIASKLYRRYDSSKLVLPDMVHIQNFPRRDPGRTLTTIGMCFPASCSIQIFEQIINDLIPEHSNNFSIQIPKELCQRNKDPEVTTKDKIIIGVFIILFGLVFISTGYDVLCTVFNRNKSGILLAFSFYTNGKKLFSLTEINTADEIKCLHGIRVLAGQWTVLGHTFLILLIGPINNRIVHATFFSAYRSMVIISGPVAVDTFFVLSGLLVSRSILKRLEKNGRLNVLQLYFHRYMRLTPLVAVLILTTMLLHLIGGANPKYSNTKNILKAKCDKYWWMTLLYFQNYSDGDYICLAPTWSSSVDMQLFLISPAIIYLFRRFKVKALIPFILLLLGCIYFTLSVHVKYNLTTLFAFQTNKFELAYVPTHIRFSSWLIGVIVGYFHFVTRGRKIRIPTMLNACFWTLSLTTMIVTIFINYPLQQLDENNRISPFVYGLYDALSRIAWSITLCYIIFACDNGYGGVINRFLSHPFWLPLSRISYAIYMLHNYVIGIVINTPTSQYFSETEAYKMFIVVYVVTIFVSIIGTLAFETPINVIEKELCNYLKQKEIAPSNANEIQQTDDSKKYQ